jgi:hypothetical protein
MLTNRLADLLFPLFLRPQDKGYYASLCDFGQGGVQTQIELDLLRTFPFNKFFDSPTARGISKLRRVLVSEL